jgi:mannose-6-phosphate isomerase
MNDPKDLNVPVAPPPPALYPMQLTPILLPKPWGGRALGEKLNKTLPDDQPYGESWEMHDSTVVINGEYAGKTLGELTTQLGIDLIGINHDTTQGFPLLAKFIDANEWLSVQNHPNDAQAAELEGEPRGKTEAWYIVGAQPSAQLIIGVQPGMTREDVVAAINDGTIEQKMVYADVIPGDVLYVEAGVIHALGPGTLIYEIQQSSDTTYRLYDWGRMGLDGKPRELHLEKGLQVATLDSLPKIHHTSRMTGLHIEIVRSAYFRTQLIQLNVLNGQQLTLNTSGTSFHCLTSIGGEALVQAGADDVPLTIGQTVLIPSGLGAYTLTTRTQARILMSAQA